MREDVVGDNRCRSVKFNFCRFPESSPLVLLKRAISGGSVWARFCEQFEPILVTDPKYLNFIF